VLAGLSTRRRSLLAKKVLVVGCGPGGLRAAVEARLHGAEVTVLEPREGFTRMNVLHIWHFSKQDLISIGMKNMYKQFGVSTDKETVPIALVQHALLRIALVVGSTVRIGCRYTGFVASDDKTRWKATADCAPEPAYPKAFRKEIFEFDSIVDGTGRRGIVRSTESLPGHGQVISGRAASGQAVNYAFTCNFAKFTGDHADQMAKGYQFHMAEFSSKQVQLDVIVYFRSLVAHYVIGTVKADELFKHGVIHDASLTGDAFMASSNRNQSALEKMALTVGDDWAVPNKAGFFEEGPDSRGNLKPSVALF